MSTPCPCGEHRSYAEHMRNIGVISAETVRINQRDRTLAKDRDAYRRMRRNGLQPRTLDGCAELETRAHDRFEVERGKIYTAEERRRMEAGMRLAEDLRLGLV